MCAAPRIVTASGARTLGKAKRGVERHQRVCTPAPTCQKGTQRRDTSLGGCNSDTLDVLRTEICPRVPDLGASAFITRVLELRSSSHSPTIQKSISRISCTKSALYPGRVTSRGGQERVTRFTSISSGVREKTIAVRVSAETIFVFRDVSIAERDSTVLFHHSQNETVEHNNKPVRSELSSSYTVAINPPRIGPLVWHDSEASQKKDTLQYVHRFTFGLLSSQLFLLGTASFSRLKGSIF